MENNSTHRTMPAAITLLEFNRRVNSLIHTDAVQLCWILAETSDVMVRNGHCYMELIQKNPLSGQTVARARAIVWANRFAALRRKFESATGQTFATGMKVMVEASANFHEQFGFSLIISDIDPSYTLGDMARQRIEIINRLTNEGIIDMNRQLDIPPVVRSIAVISAGSAAGYGDFIRQLNDNPSRLKFYTCLFQASMQGANTVPSVIAALERINSHAELFDCVVIIRGGGATSELNAFDNYDLAANIAQFPLPVISGIGHDRDKTVVDVVAAVSLKTPTAVAAWIVDRAQTAYDYIVSLGNTVAEKARQMLTDAHRQVDYYGNSIPLMADNMLTRHRTRLQRLAAIIPITAASRTEAAGKELHFSAERIREAVRQRIQAETNRLDSLGKQAELLSPSRVLKRGYSLTTSGGRVVTDASRLKPGDELLTQFASGSVTSRVE